MTRDLNLVPCLVPRQQVNTSHPSRQLQLVPTSGSIVSLSLPRSKGKSFWTLLIYLPFWIEITRSSVLCIREFNICYSRQRYWRSSTPQTTWRFIVVSYPPPPFVPPSAWTFSVSRQSPLPRPWFPPPPCFNLFCFPSESCCHLSIQSIL